MSTTNRLNLVHNKASASTNNQLVFRSGLGNFNNASKLTLVGYSIGGIVGALPNHLMMRMTNSSTQTYNMVQQEANTVLDFNENYKMLFPASGAMSEMKTELLNSQNGAPINLNGMRFYFETYNPTTETYDKFTDYTEIAMEFEVEMFSEVKSIKRDK